MKSKLTPAEMLRAASAELPVEDAAMRKALTALSKAIDTHAVNEWRLVHLKCAQEALEMAVFTAWNAASREWDEEGWGKGKNE